MTHIGSILKSHGIKGELWISHLLNNPQELQSWDAIMIELNPGSYIPFFIEKINSLQPETALVQLEEITTPEAAKKLAGKKIYAPPTVNITQEQMQYDPVNFIGYTIYYKEQLLGVVQEILGNEMNLLFSIINNNQQEILIPAHEDFMQEINNADRKIILNLPDGLLESLTQKD